LARVMRAAPDAPGCDDVADRTVDNTGVACASANCLEILRHLLRLRCRDFPALDDTFGASARIFRPMQSRIDAEILVPAWPAAKICGERTMQADDIKSDTRRAQSVPAYGSAAGRCCWPRIGRGTCARRRR